MATKVVIAKPSSEHRLKIRHQCALFAILTPFFAVREILGRMLVANPAMIPDIRLSEQPQTWDGRATFGGYCAEFVAQNSSSKPSRKMTARNELRIAKKPSRFDRLLALAYLVVTLSGLAWAKEFFSWIHQLSSGSADLATRTRRTQTGICSAGWKASFPEVLPPARKIQLRLSDCLAGPAQDRYHP
jgi:hypothetical protein